MCSVRSAHFISLHTVLYSEQLCQIGAYSMGCTVIYCYHLLYVFILLLTCIDIIHAAGICIFIWCAICLSIFVCLCYFLHACYIALINFKQFTFIYVWHCDSIHVCCHFLHYYCYYIMFRPEAIFAFFPTYFSFLQFFFSYLFFSIFCSLSSYFLLKKRFSWCISSF